MSLEDEYNGVLRRVIAVAGHSDDTDTAELESLLHRFHLEPGEVGSYTDFENRQKDSDPALYGIYNTMHKPPGQHWFCTYGDYVYDPLGVDDSDTAEQPAKSDDCGQRCIAYLILCKKKGKAVAL
jgi:hypothetical protein